jgi:hypothetical protein
MKRKKPYHRNVHSDLTITMSKPFADPTADVELTLPNGAVTAVKAGILNHEYHCQQAAYAAEAHIDAHGVWRGPTGIRRPSNRIRKVSVADLVVEPGDCIRSAA